MTGKTRRRLGLCALAALLLFALIGGADAHSLRSLRSRLRAAQARRAALQATLREIKSEQLTAHRKLRETQSELAASRRRLSQAKARLARVRGELRSIKAEQRKTQAELEAHRQAMSDRILAVWRSGQPSYFEVMLEATTFEDFSNRLQYTRMVTDQDQDMLNQLAELRDRLARQRAALEAKEREAAALRTRVASETAAVERHTRQAAALAREADRERARAEAEYAAEVQALNELAAMIRRIQAAGVSHGAYSGTSDGRFIRPVNGRLTSPFGYRIHPILGYRKFHNGIDIAAPSGTPIYAAADGKVVYVGWRGALGNAVMIDHGSGWATVYGHCSSFACSPGQIVRRGQIIARVGSTGRSTGPHVHWTVYHNGEAVNPLNHS